MASEFPQYLCDQINTSSCIPLDLETTSYLSRSGSVFGIQVDAPYTLALLLMGIFTCVRMHQHTNNMHACIGKGEMTFLLKIFCINNLLLVAVVNFQNLLVGFSLVLYGILAGLQLSAYASFYFALFASGITTDRIHGIMKMRSHNFLWSMTVGYFVVLSIFNGIGMLIRNYFIFPIVILLNTLAVMGYFITQVKKLKKTKSDIWAYGVLCIIFVLYILSMLPVFLGAELIAILTEKNLDNFFFFQVFNTLFVTMVHKYWLQTCDFEIECLELEA